MHELDVLRDLVILVAVAIPVVAAAQKFKIPTVVGFLLTGLVIGPHALKLISRQEEVSGLAEIGVVLLLFTIGLELSLSRIMRMGRAVLQGGGVQVGATTLLTALSAVALGFPFRQSVFFGMLMALSSTAVVLKLYNDRRELDSPHARIGVGILLFQDLCVVPFMLLAPLLASAGGLAAALRDTLVSLVVVGVLIAGGRYFVPWALERVVGIRNREIFTLCVMFFVLLAAFTTASFGLSLALGAFIAGLLISESNYGLQALSDVLPFRDPFTGIFFISVGMLVDPAFLWDKLFLILSTTLAVVLMKALIGAVAAKSLKRPLQVSVVCGLGLAQVGEFSLLLASVGVTSGLLTDETYQVFLAISVLSMLMTPLLIAGAVPIANALGRWTRQPALRLTTREYEAAQTLSDHVVIVGYGLNGRNLARTLKAAHISYVILEQNGHAVRQARLKREPILFGDGTRGDVLDHVGIQRARVLVFAISASADTRRGVAVARKLSTQVHILVRTRFVSELKELLELGANHVIPEEFETSIEIFSRVLRLYGVPTNLIAQEVEAVRRTEYEMLRGLSLPDLGLDALKHFGLHTIVETIAVEPDSKAIGENPITLNMRYSTGATAIAAVRNDKPLHMPDPGFQFAAGDTVVLVGRPEELAAAISLFRQPKALS